MNNKEYVLKNHIDKLFEAWSIYGCCDLCKDLGCREYCRSMPDLPCEETLKSWLEKEHNSITLNFGEICEVVCLPSITELMYYVGSELCFHYFAKTKEEVEQIGKSGITHYPKNNLKCFYFKDLEHFVKKVGD